MASPNLRELEKAVAARLGKVDGVSKRTALGHSDSVGTNLRPLYQNHNTADLNIADLIGTNSTIKLASTSANDDEGGSGATIVQVSGVDENLAFTTENVTLNGTTEVETTTVWRAVEKLQVIAAGAGGQNAGTIWAGNGVFTAGVPATKYNSMEAGTNVSALCFINVPAGRQFLVDQLSIYSGDTTKVLNFQFYQYSNATGLWYEAFDVHGKQGSILQPVSSYPALNEGDAIMMRVNVDTGTAIITGAIAGYMVES